MSKKINIRPTTSVYATYKNINYQLYTAIAEFVDNSTQSYYDNKTKLKESKYWHGCEIHINHQKDENGEWYLEIKDNAFGMDFHDFQRAIILDSKPNKVSRSEFGMGLKTAACWFGLKWSVESTALGSEIKYKTTVDVEHLSKYKNEEIEVEEIECNKKEHGTTIKIWNLNRNIQGRSVKKTKDMLRGMYRVDIRSGEIKIFYNDDLLTFEEPEVYEENINGNIVRWEKDNISFQIEHNNKIYHVSGKIAIRKTASIAESGFTLIRRGRVIVGGYENNYRPEDVFGKSNSFEYQRIFGELNLDDWPVVQTKDNFDWNNGLEDKFIDKLSEISQDYIKKSRVIRKRKIVDTLDTQTEMINEFEKKGIISNPHIESIKNDNVKNDENVINNENCSENDNAVSLINNHFNIISFEIADYKYHFEFIIETEDKYSEWLKIERNESKDTYSVKWNIRHPFFKKLAEDAKSVSIMQSFIFALAISEVQARKIGENGNISAGAIRKNMNSILSYFVEE